MTAEMILSAGYADPSRGWGGIWGLLAGAFVVYLMWRGDKWRQDKKAGEGDPSPALPPPPVSHENAQVDHVSSHVSRETTLPRGGGETPHWGGSIRRVNGSLRRVYSVARHVAKTGESPPREYQPNAGVADDIDLPLFDDDEERSEEFEPQPERQPAMEVPPPRETQEQYAARLHRQGEDKATIVAGLVAHYGVSRATAYRVHDRAVPSRGKRPAA